MVGRAADRRGPSEAISTSAARRAFFRRVTEFGEPIGILRDIRPLPVGVEDIRRDVSTAF